MKPLDGVEMNSAYDVVVVGAGGAGMTAALAAARQGLNTVLIEKSAYWGGSTARSGGGVWIPGNTGLERDAPRGGTPDAARTHLHAIIGDVVPAERIDTYVDRGPEALQFLLDNAPLKLEWVKNYS